MPANQPASQLACPPAHLPTCPPAHLPASQPASQPAGRPPACLCKLLCKSPRFKSAWSWLAVARNAVHTADARQPFLCITPRPCSSQRRMRWWAPTGASPFPPSAMLCLLRLNLLMVIIPMPSGTAKGVSKLLSSEGQHGKAQTQPGGLFERQWHASPAGQHWVQLNCEPTFAVKESSKEARPVQLKAFEATDSLG
ncbi:hypothetical protein V8C86DRAFT_1325280 [Haematococcus lacustris]